MSSLDARIIGGIDPLPSPGEMQDKRALRDIQRDENAIRREEILARRDALRQQALDRNKPKPVDEKSAFDLRLAKAKTVAHLLKGTDETNYPLVRQMVGQLVGPEALTDLPEQFDATHIAALAKMGDEAIAHEAKTREITTTNADGSTTIRIVKDEPDQEFTSAPKPISATNPTEASLAVAAAKGDKDAASALRIMRAQRVGSGGGGPKPRAVTSGDANKVAELNNSLKDLDTLGATISGVSGATGAKAAAGAALPNFVTSITGLGTEAKEKQAVIDRVKQVIGKSLEGGVLRKEDEDKYKKILPTISDAPDVVNVKLAGLKQAIEQKRDEHLSALEDAGYDTAKFRARAEQKAPAAAPAPTPSTGVTVTAPNGKTYTFKNKAQADVFKKRAGIP